MLVEAQKILGHAWLAGLRPHARCLRGRRRGPVKVEPCGYAASLSLETLIWAKGARYPLWRLAHRRLRCPRCGGLDVELVWLPGAAIAVRQAQDLVQCQNARDGVRGP